MDHPMVTISRRPRPRGSEWINRQLETARHDDEVFFAELEDSRLAVPGAADFDECIFLSDRAPSPALRGYVLGLLAGNFL